MWWRILIPTWRFFDNSSARPRLWISEYGMWREAWPKPKQHWYSLFFNPEMSAWHARGNLLDRLVLELSASATTSELVSYRLLEDLVRQAVGGGKYRFKISVGDDDILVSPELGGT